MDICAIITALVDWQEFIKVISHKIYEPLLKRLKLPNPCFLSNILMRSTASSFSP